jgi:DNA-binding response OmpR family regulator
MEPTTQILLIEDHGHMRENLLLMLEMEGFAVLSAPDGSRGLELARARKPDLILCDVMMPGLDGHGVLRALRQDPATATIPLIFLTAKGEKADQRTGMNLGADDYLVKPVGKQELLAAIRARLQRRQQHERDTQTQLSQVRFAPDFSSATPLEALGLSPREAQVLLWIAQGKNNEEIGIILGAARNTIKKHVVRVLGKLGSETRNAAAIRALELLSAPKACEREGPTTDCTDNTDKQTKSAA